jgi:hypothetical protein
MKISVSWDITSVVRWKWADVSKEHNASIFRIKEQVKKNQYEADSGLCLLSVPCWSYYSNLKMDTATSLDHTASHPVTVIVRAFDDFFIVFWSWNNHSLQPALYMSIIENISNDLIKLIFSTIEGWITDLFLQRFLNSIVDHAHTWDQLSSLLFSGTHGTLYLFFGLRDSNFIHFFKYSMSWEL